MQRDENVRRLDVAVDDAFLVRMLDRLTNLDEQFEPFLGGKLVLVAVIGDANAPHQFHHKVGPARFGCARIQHFSDVGMIHHRQRLPLRLKPCNHRLGVHAQLDDLQRDTSPDRLGLFGDIDHAATTFTDFFEQFVTAEGLAHGFVRRIGQIEFDGGLLTVGAGGNSFCASCAASSASRRWRNAGSPIHMASNNAGRLSAGISSAAANNSSSRL